MNLEILDNTIQLRRITMLQWFYMDKHSDKNQNHNESTYKIYSYASRNEMIDFAHRFGKFIKGNYPTIRQVKDIGIEQVNSYLASKGNVTQKTMQHEVACLNKLSLCVNKKFGIPYNENGYSTEELDALILSTNVKISSYAIDNPKGTWKTISGNIYDIDDEYIYILTCGHSFVDTTKEYEELGIDNLIKEINITFINGEKISFNPNSIYINRKQDISLVLLDKNLVSSETLNIIRSINIDHMYQKNLDNTTIYEYAYSLSDKTYIKYYALIKSTTNRVLDIQNTNIINGCSGGGFFDNTGTYCGMTYNSIFVNYIDVIPTLYELIILANPNY